MDEQLIAKAIWECLKENDPDGVIEILEIHLSAKNKSQLAKEHDFQERPFIMPLKVKILLYIHLLNWYMQRHRFDLLIFVIIFQNEKMHVPRI